MDTHLGRRLFSYLYPHRSLLVLAIVLLVVAKGIEAFIPIYIGYIVQLILHSSPLYHVFHHSFIVIGLLLGAFVLDELTVIIKNWIGQKGLFRLRQDIFDHILHLPIEYYNKHSVGGMMTRTIHDVDQINLMFSESIVPLIGSTTLFFCICMGLIVVDWRVAIFVGFILPFVLMLTNHFRTHQRRCYDKIRTIVAKMNSFIQEHLMGASTIRSFGLEKQEKERFDQINEEHRQANIETIHHFAFFFAGINFVQSFSYVAIFAVLVIWATNGTEFNVGTYFTFSLYILMLFRPLADLAERYNVLQSAFAASSRIFHVMDQGTERGFDPVSEKMSRIESIEFEDVWFAYIDENWVLKGLSFKVHHGDSVALVGMTGAGKTTVMNLLLRFYTNQKGVIRINGKDIRNIPLQTVRKLFSVVLQDPELFSGSIADNMTLGNPEIDRKDLQKVADYVNMTALLEKFRLGLDHPLTERGKSLSVGERQLVSLGRSVVQDRPILILDEATANIDSKTEQLIQSALKKILKHKTALVIAHRLSTIRDVNTIIVLHEGVAVEVGSHQELLQRKGIYEKLYRLQYLDIPSSSTNH